MLITNRDLYCLQVQLGVNKDQIKEAISAVGNNPSQIERYIQQRSKPHIMQLLNSQPNLYDEN